MDTYEAMLVTAGIITLGSLLVVLWRGRADSRLVSTLLLVVFVAIVLLGLAL